MSANKNAQLRYQILDRCFSNFRQRYTIEDLVEEVVLRLLMRIGMNTDIFYRSYARYNHIMIHRLVSQILQVKEHSMNHQIREEFEKQLKGYRLSK